MMQVPRGLEESIAFASLTEEHPLFPSAREGAGVKASQARDNGVVGLGWL